MYGIKTLTNTINDIEQRRTVMNQQKPEQFFNTSGSIEQLAAVGIPGMQPMFFFDGKFRTWREVQTRAGLNSAIASQIPAYRLTPVA